MVLILVPTASASSPEPVSLPVQPPSNPAFQHHSVRPVTLLCPARLRIMGGVPLLRCSHYPASGIQKHRLAASRSQIAGYDVGFTHTLTSSHKKPLHLAPGSDASGQNELPVGRRVEDSNAVLAHPDVRWLAATRPDL